MTNQESLSLLLNTLRRLDDERIQAERFLQEDPTNILETVVHLFTELYPYLPAIENQFQQLRNLMNDALAATEDQ